MNINILEVKQALEPKVLQVIRLLAKLILQKGKAPKVRGHSTEESPVLT